MTNHPHKFIWLEFGKSGFIYVRAKQIASGWQFHTKSVMDTRWRPAESSVDRINKAEELKSKALTHRSDKDDFVTADTFTNIQSGGSIPLQLTTDLLFALTQPSRPQQPTLKGWQHPTIVVIGLALLVSGGVAISAGWQVALIVHFVDLVALIWGRYKGLY